jgi:hypothetical protein
MAKKIMRQFMAGYKGETNVPYFAGIDGTQYPPERYAEMCNSAEFEIVESITAMQILARQETFRESTLGKGWTKDPNYKIPVGAAHTRTTPRESSGEDTRQRIKNAYRLLGIAEANDEETDDIIEAWVLLLGSKEEAKIAKGGRR